MYQLGWGFRARWKHYYLACEGCQVPGVGLGQSVCVTLISPNVRAHQNLINCQKSLVSSVWMKNNVAICLPGHGYRMGWLIEKKIRYPERHSRPLCVCSCGKIIRPQTLRQSTEISYRIICIKGNLTSQPLGNFHPPSLYSELQEDFFF